MAQPAAGKAVLLWEIAALIGADVGERAGRFEM